jgi:hypothetical protein
MTQKELVARRQGVPERVIMALRPLFHLVEEVMEGAKRAVEDGDVSRWLPAKLPRLGPASGGVMAGGGQSRNRRSVLTDVEFRSSKILGGMPCARHT